MVDLPSRDGEAGSADSVADDLVGAGGAFDDGDWEAAERLYAQSDQGRALSGDDLERWAQAIQWQGRVMEAVAPLERAVAAHSSRGDRRGAARAALLLANIHFEKRQIAVATGWLSRAASYLAGDEECREGAILDCMESRRAAAEGRLEDALELAERSVEKARKLGDAEQEALGLMYCGHARLALGDVATGADLEREAAASVLAGQVRSWVGGMIYCGVIWGCCNRGDWDQAAEWTEHLGRWCERSGVASYSGLCRLHRAEVMVARGELTRAEEEIVEARSQLAESAALAEGDAWRVEGDIRLARGDLDGAEQCFSRAHRLGWDPQPGWAVLQAARGHHEAALRSLERSIADRAWPNQQRRGLLLVQLAILASEAGDLERAAAALEELESGRELWRTRWMQALMHKARGEVAAAEGRRDEAIVCFRRGLRLGRDVGSEIQMSSCRLRLAELLLDEGERLAAEMELDAVEPTLQRLGAAPLQERCVALRGRLG